MEHEEDEVVEVEENRVMAYEEESTPSWGDPEITPDYIPEYVEVKLDPDEFAKAMAGLTEEDLPF